MSASFAGAWAAWVLCLVAPWRTRARRAPRPRRPAAAGRRWRLIVALVALAVAATAGPALGAAVVATAWVGRRWSAARVRRRATRAAAACVPDLGELLRIGIAAGLTPVLAIEQLADLAPEPARSAAAAVLDATARGQRFADAVTLLASRLGPSARPLVDALAATDRYGVALEPVLDAALADLRRQRRTAAAEAARRLPVSLSFPLVGCVLPAFALLTLAPLLAGAFASLRGVTSGSQVGVAPPAVGASAPRPVVRPGGTGHEPSPLDPLAAAERAAAASPAP